MSPGFVLNLQSPWILRNSRFSQREHLMVSLTQAEAVISWDQIAPSSSKNFSRPPRRTRTEITVNQTTLWPGVLSYPHPSALPQFFLHWNEAHVGALKMGEMLTLPYIAVWIKSLCTITSVSFLNGEWLDLTCWNPASSLGLWLQLKRQILSSQPSKGSSPACWPLDLQLLTFRTLTQ
jgi:hypothetical protein